MKSQAQQIVEFEIALKLDQLKDILRRLDWKYLVERRRKVTLHSFKSD